MLRLYKKCTPSGRQMSPSRLGACRNTTTIYYWYPYTEKLVTCQQQFAQLHHVVLKHRGYRAGLPDYNGALQSPEHKQTLVNTGARSERILYKK